MYQMSPGRLMFACHLDVFICFKYIVFSFMLVSVSVHVTCGCIRAGICSASSCYCVANAFIPLSYEFDLPAINAITLN